MGASFRLLLLVSKMGVVWEHDRNGGLIGGPYKFHSPKTIHFLRGIRSMSSWYLFGISEIQAVPTMIPRTVIPYRLKDTSESALLSLIKKW